MEDRPAWAASVPLNEDGFPGRALGRLFAVHGELSDVGPLGRGHIHQTWLAGYRSGDGSTSYYVHQRLNTTVFGDPATVMANMTRVTGHLAARVTANGRTEPHRRSLCLVPAADGSPAAVDADGATWRTFAHIDRAVAPLCFTGPVQAAEAAAAAARFVADLIDLPGPPLPEVIAGFHDVGSRLAALERAAEADTARRAGGCRAEVGAVLAAAGLASDVADARAAGRLPPRTVHNDAKADNVLFDEVTGRALCLVDLDTVGTGTVLFDVGDLVRSGAATTAEDADVAAGGAGEVGVRADVVEAVLRGYAEAGAGFLTDAEVALLPLGGPLMALEAGARFLTDHLRGDVYFRVDRPGHNLVRARNQIRVLDALVAMLPRS